MSQAMTRTGPFHLPCDGTDEMPAALQETLRAAGLESSLPAPGSAPLEAPDFSAEIALPAQASGGFVCDANGVTLLIAASRSGIRADRIAQITEACLDHALAFAEAVDQALDWISALFEGEQDEAPEPAALRRVLLSFADAIKPPVPASAVAHCPLQALQALTERDYSAGPGLAVPPADLVSVADVIRSGDAHTDQHRAAFARAES